MKKKFQVEEVQLKTKPTPKASLRSHFLI